MFPVVSCALDQRTPRRILRLRTTICLGRQQDVERRQKPARWKASYQRDPQVDTRRLDLLKCIEKRPTVKLIARLIHFTSGAVFGHMGRQQTQGQ